MRYADGIIDLSDQDREVFHGLLTPYVDAADTDTAAAMLGRMYELADKTRRLSDEQQEPDEWLAVTARWEQQERVAQRLSAMLFPDVQRELEHLHGRGHEIVIPL